MQVTVPTLSKERSSWHPENYDTTFKSVQSPVASEVPLNDIINNRDATGRIAKWAIELLPFDITYKPRQTIKSEVLADFVAEWTEAELPKEYGTYSNWIMHFDGSKMLAGLGAGVVLTSPTGDTVQYVLQILYTDSNNAAEYEGLHGLRMAVSMGIQRLEVRGDSNLAISQINGDFDAKDPKWRLTAMTSSKCQLGSRGSNSTMWFDTSPTYLLFQTLFPCFGL